MLKSRSEALISVLVVYFLSSSSVERGNDLGFILHPGAMFSVCEPLSECKAMQS